MTTVSRDFVLTVAPELLVSYLGDPRNIGVSNDPGTITEALAEPTVGAGSWAIVARGQTRTRIEYLRYEPPEVLVSLAYSGPGTGNQSGTWRYSIAPDVANGGTRLRVEIASPDRRVLDALARPFLPIMWWQLRRHLKGIAGRR